MDSADSKLESFEVRSTSALLQILETGNIALWEWNLSNGENLVTPAWAALLGYDIDELTPISYDSFAALVHPDDMPQVDSNVRGHILGKTPKYSANFRMRHKDGSWCWIKAQGLITKRDEQGSPLLMSGVHLDITPLKQTEDELRKRSITDDMTGWYNRGYFMQAGATALRRALRQGSRLAVIMFDIDHFKSINDNYGHAKGDDVIKQLTHTIAERLRSVDVAARMGGEEFVVMLEGASLGDARAIAETIRHKVEELEFDAPHGGTFKVTASFGATMLDDDDVRLEQLLARADQALYKAKANGRNRTELA